MRLLNSNETVVCGTAFHAPVCGEVEVLEDYLFCFAYDGVITQMLSPEDQNYAEVLAASQAAGRLTQLDQGQYLIPGLIDLHIHAPQWPLTGKAIHLPVMQWLEEYAMPLESRYSDLRFAERVYQDLVKTLLANGTTTALYFATIHKQATLRLAEICHEKGQRALVGKVVMDHDSAPDYYRDVSPEQALADTRWLIDAIRAIPDNQDLVQPVITPRFIPNCSDAVLSALGQLAQQTGVHVQTHCEESDWVHQHVQQRMGKSDTQALNDFGLLTRRTVLAHANHIGDQDMHTVRQQGSAVAHCPLSNAFFANSVLPVAKHLRNNTHMGLGTDISAGFTPSLFDSMRQSIVSARMLEDGVDPAYNVEQRQQRANSRINFREAFWLATTGGGLSLDLPIGYFAQGQQFDAQIIDLHAPGSNISGFTELDSQLDILQKIVTSANRHNVHTVWVAGQQVHTK